MANSSGGKKSRDKGKEGERELGRILGGILGGAFIRSAHSGAFVGGKNAHRKASLGEGQTTSLKGDLVPPDHLPKLVIEAKSYAAFRFHQLLQPGPSPLLDGWIAQCLDVVDPGDLWMVCFKVTRVGWFVAIPVDGTAKWSLGNHVSYTGRHGPFHITDLTGFLTDNREAILARAG